MPDPSNPAMEPVVEKFHPTGQVGGWLSVLAGLFLAGIAVTGDDQRVHSLGAVGLLVAALSWASMVRPALWVERSGQVRDLVLRNGFTTTRLPLAAIERLAVEQVLFVWVGDKRYGSPVLGRSRRKVIKGVPDQMPDELPADKVPYNDFVKGRLHDHMSEAQQAAGVRPASDEQQALASGVSTTVDPLPLVVVGVPLLLFVLALFL